MDELDLADWRRRVADLYGEVRRSPPGPATWARWRESRDALLAAHPQSPVPPGGRPLPFWGHDPSLRFEAEVRPAPGVAARPGEVPMRPVGRVEVLGASLVVWWLEEYSGGLFVPFRDATNGTDTYGGGRYLLDTAKGADLGFRDGRLVLDFNYAYHPSCAHDARWSCPLAPPENVLAVPVRAGERLAGP